MMGYAFKIPRFYSYLTFLWGLIANYNEMVYFKTFNDEKLCPVIYSFPLGIIIVMPVARILTDREFDLVFKREDWYIKGTPIPSENKPDSYGYLNGKLVCVDYG